MMRSAFYRRLSAFCGVSLLLGCVAPQPLATRPVPVSVSPEAAHGRAVVSLRWPDAAPRSVQTIPWAAVTARLSVFDASGSLLATASIQRQGDAATSTASLEIPAGEEREIEAVLDAAQEPNIALGRSQAFPVRRNQVVEVPLTLEPLIRTLYGGGASRGDGGPAAAAKFNQPQRLSVGADGTLYVADNRNHAIRAIAPDGTIRTIVGLVLSGTAVKTTLSPDNSGEAGPASEATAAAPFRVYAASNGDLFYADMPSNSPIVVRVHLVPALNGRRFGLDVLAGHVYTIATFSTVGSGTGLALDRDGALLISEPDANRIHRLGPDDSTTSVLVGQTPTVTTDGALPGEVSLGIPQDVVLDAHGNLLFAESAPFRLRMLCREGGTHFGVAMQAGRVYTVLADPRGSDADEPKLPWSVSSAPSVRQMALDGAGNLYFVDNINHAVFREDAKTRVVTRIAGGAKTASGAMEFGDGGAAVSATLNLPQGLAIDALNRLLIGDTFNHRIRGLYL